MPCLIHAYIGQYISLLERHPGISGKTNENETEIVEIESTGSHTQFYDKFNIRYYITQLFKLVWSNPTHRESLKRESL